ncbi:MAG: glycosyltransferase family 2 protein [Bacteroidales bacterium]|nr:glycosyltransferase family 2 protein [Bacteroidales bacterium]
MHTLTVFTPTYNRAHTLPRLYQSLCCQSCMDFDWLVIDDGSSDETRDLVQGWIKEGIINVQYIYKENGGLYTGYNTAYEAISTDLNVCIDSDDAMPRDAVETILYEWQRRGSKHVAGLIGLDVYMDSGKPIGGAFLEGLTECYLLDLYTKRIHRGDSKQVMRTDLMKQVAPQVGFPGEKNFNPIYLLLQVCDDYPLLVVNKPLCLVEYQTGDSMSRNIWHQYFDSPRSFAKLRKLEMHLKRSTPINRCRSAIHYAAESLIAFFVYTLCRKN